MAHPLRDVDGVSRNSVSKPSERRAGVTGCGFQCWCRRFSEGDQEVPPPGDRRVRDEQLAASVQQRLIGARDYTDRGVKTKFNLERDQHSSMPCRSHLTDR